MRRLFTSPPELPVAESAAREVSASECTPSSATRRCRWWRPRSAVSSPASGGSCCRAPRGGVPGPGAAGHRWRARSRSAWSKPHRKSSGGSSGSRRAGCRRSVGQVGAEHQRTALVFHRARGDVVGVHEQAIPPTARHRSGSRPGGPTALRSTGCAARARLSSRQRRAQHPQAPAAGVEAAGHHGEGVQRRGSCRTAVLGKTSWKARRIIA